MICYLFRQPASRFDVGALLQGVQHISVIGEQHRSLKSSDSFTRVTRPSQVLRHARLDIFEGMLGSRILVSQRRELEMYRQQHRSRRREAVD